MKKLLVLLVVITAILCATVMTAAAVSYDYCAEELHKLGLLQGTDDGFDLNRVPTRAEALVMLIRLYGLEEEALAGEYETPFTDVPVWAEKYVGYAYENGLTSGTAAATFGSDDDCSAQMYVTFVLRALGYSDSNGDFSYDNAVNFGKTVNVIDDILAGGTFLRDQMAAISYLALSAQPKNGEFDTLLGKLESDGAVSAENAKTLADNLSLLDEFLMVSSSLNNEKKISMSGSMDMEMSVMGQVTSVNMDVEASVIMENDDILASVFVDTVFEDEIIAMECFMSDGYVYMNMMGQKTRMEVDFSEILAIANTQEAMSNLSYVFKSVNKQTDGELTSYTAVLSDGYLSGALEQATAMMSQAGLQDIGSFELSFGDVIIKLYTDADGVMKKIAMSMDTAIEVSTEGSTLSMPMNMSMEFEINAVGDAVTVTLPEDLADYTDMDAIA